MTCETQTDPYIIIASTPKVQIGKPSDIKKHTLKVLYNNSIQLESWHEYALGACQGHIHKRIDLRFLSPRFKSSEYQKRLFIAQTARKKPMIILFLTIDSFSRRHFYRKMTETLEYFEKLKNYSVADYKLHNIKGADTAENQFWVFSDFETTKNWNSEDYLGESAIWYKMRKKGFMTL